MMDSERWKQIDEIFHAALDRAPSTRAAFLAEVCKDDDSLRTEIEALIASHEKESTLFENPPADLAAQLLANQDTYKGTIAHYKILKKIGSGGMGEVYLAEDTRLNRKVALKLLPSEFTNDIDRVHRFEREAKAASALNHPNILTIYDIGQFNSSSFIASEYIDGETLRSKLRKSKLPLKEILSIGIQVAEALDAAHRAGIIHRDIKPENIMHRKDGYVKVLDFGLAKLIETQEVSQTASLETLSKTQTGIVLGTLRYMSPEQARGLSIDARSDLFSLGVVLYEMISSKVPFDGATSSDVLVAILEKQPPPVDPKIPDELQWIVTKALTKDRDERYQTAKDLLADLRRIRRQLEIEQELKSSGITRRTQRSRRRGYFAIAALLILATLFSIYFFRERRLPRSKLSSQSIAERIRPSVAVIGFKNLSGANEAAWISAALAEMLSTELAVGEKLLVISGEDVTRSKKELSLDYANSFSQETLSKVRKNLPADYLVLGAYYVPPGQKQIRLDLNVQKTEDGEITARFTETRNELDLLGLVLAAGSRLRQSLGIVPLNEQQINSARSTLSSNPDALRFYSQGISRLRELDRRGAQDFFSMAVKADPKFPLAYSGLSQAWFELGYIKKAHDAAKAALDLSDFLSREERLLVEGRFHQANYDTESAIRCYQSLLTFFPDNLEYGLLLANVQISAGMITDAKQTIQHLRKLPSPFNEDPRIDLTDLQTFELYDAERNLKLAQTAAEKARLRGAQLLEAKALTSQGITLGALNQKSESIAAYERAKLIYKSHNCKGDLLVLDDYISEALKESGDFKSALELNDGLLKSYREAGDERNLASTYFRRGHIQRWLGNPDDSLKSFEAARQIFEKIGNQESLGYSLSTIADFYSFNGDLAKSEQYYREAIALLNSTKSLQDLERNLQSLGRIKNRTGKKDEARQLFQQALEIDRTLKSRKGVADCLVALASLDNGKQELQTALQYLDSLLKDFKKEKTVEGQFFVLEKLQSLYQANNDVSNVTRVIREKLPIIRNFKNPWRREAELQSCGFTLTDFGFLQEAEILGNEIINSGKSNFGHYLLCNVQWDQGNITQFKKTLSALHNPKPGMTWYGESYVLKLEGSLHFEFGDLLEGEKRFKEAVKRATAAKDYGWLFLAVSDLAELNAARADYEQAEQLFQQAYLNARKESSESSMITYYKQLGNYYFKRGKLKEAEKQWNTGIDYCEKEKSLAEKVVLQAKIAHCRILQGDIEKGAELLKATNEEDLMIREKFWTVVEIRHAKARLLAAQKKYDQAVQLLNGIIKKAGQEGLIRLLLETNLILSDIEIQAGKKSNGISLLQSVAKEAKEHGFINIADRASSLQKKSF